MQQNLFSTQQDTEQLVTEIDAHRQHIPAKQVIEDDDRIDLASMPDIETRWVIPYLMAKGKVSMLAGDRGIGKSYLTTKIASAITNGEIWHDGTKLVKEAILFINVEDDPGTMKVRLSHHGANFDKIHYYNIVTINAPQSSQKSAKGTFQLPRDIAWLDAMIKDKGVGAVIIDNVGGCFHNADTNRFVHEQIMLPLVGIAASNDVAILLINHRTDKTTRKSDNSASLTNLSASIAHAKCIQDVCRLVTYAYVPDENLNLINIKLVKTNLFATNKFPKLAYTLHSSIDGRTTCVFLNEGQLQSLNLQQNAVNTGMTVFNPCATEDLRVKSVVTLIAEYPGTTFSQIVQYFTRYTSDIKVITAIGLAVKQGKIVQNDDGGYELSLWVLAEYKRFQLSRQNTTYIANSSLP